MAWPNKPKTFQRKYRVFSAAFWQNNDTSFELERSDKIVLPPSAINALTDSNAPFPVLLKIQTIDKTTNKALPSNTFSHVIDYSAPEGLIYMSSWMISKLNLDQSGQSVVELKLPTNNNLKYQCPIAEFLQLQPHTLQLMLQDDITNLVHKSLSDYYSSLRVNDEITVYSTSNNKEYKLSVVKISGKDTSYTPKCVRLNNTISDSLMLGFSEPKNCELEEDIPNDDDHKEDNNPNEEESDGEWEIISVEKVQSVPDLAWTEPIKEEMDDDVKIPPQQGMVVEDNNDIKDVPVDAELVDIPPPEEANNGEDVPPQKEEEEPVVAQKEDVVAQAEVEDIEYTEWVCPKCNVTNEWSYKFCPKCGCSQEQWKPPKKEKKEVAADEQDKKMEDAVNVVVLKKVSVINDGTFSPNEERQTGWIVKNISTKEINIYANLVKFAGNSDVVLTFEEKQHFEMKANDEMFILIGVKAPAMPKQYHMFCQLLNADGKPICEMLSLPVIVQGEYGQKKEQMISQIYEMGFNDRNKIITALKKWNWDELKAINWLATH
eukprot:47090_1